MRERPPPVSTGRQSATPRSWLPKSGQCAKEQGQPKVNPACHTPKGTSGVADLPGQFGMITLGFSPDFVGSDFFQASTTLHELGHNLRLWHPGEPPMLGATQSNGIVNVTIPTQCKPNHPSVISYLHQMYGLVDEFGVPQIDFSRDVFGLTSESVNGTSTYVVREGQLFDAAFLPVLPTSSPSDKTTTDFRPSSKKLSI